MCNLRVLSKTLRKVSNFTRPFCLQRCVTWSVFTANATVSDASVKTSGWERTVTNVGVTLVAPITASVTTEPASVNLDGTVDIVRLVCIVLQYFCIVSFSPSKQSAHPDMEEEDTD